ncbi:hypothetical protein Tco_0053669 [Tanacetum coccineum]
MSSSSTVTYTSVYSDSEPWRFQWVSDEEPEAPPSPDYVPGLEHPPSPDYVPGPEHPPLPDYVPEPEYPEYLVPSDNEVPIKDQPLHTDASPIALSPGYVVDFDPEEDPADYPADEGDDDDDDDDEDESSEDDDEEEDSNEDEDEEEDHLASIDSAALPVVDLVPSAKETEPFKTDEFAPTPPTSPYHIILFSETRPRTTWMFV